LIKELEVKPVAFILHMFPLPWVLLLVIACLIGLPLLVPS